MKVNDDRVFACRPTKRARNAESLSYSAAFSFVADQRITAASRIPLRCRSRLSLSFSYPRPSTSTYRPRRPIAHGGAPFRGDCRAFQPSSHAPLHDILCAPLLETFLAQWHWRASASSLRPSCACARPASGRQHELAAPCGEPCGRTS